MTIDDLFSGAEVQRPAKPAAPMAVRTFSLLAIACVLTALAYIALRLMELEAPVPALFGFALAIAGLVRVTKRLRPGPRARHAGFTVEQPLSMPDGLKVAVNSWDMMLDWSHTDASRFNRRVLPRLGELADERLRQKYGITRASDPVAAREKLGDPLWTFVTMPHRRSPQAKELDHIIAALEKL
ncbi:hypothetical protein [Catelliglobosispora koreensis]|uniref:hypothetical protein n=1 Tax=Catelliglobosispora koreensis TaxID=129052 RepID=UPI0003699EF5|nr:hypothetical protein [Catelliglobosispora koreensis]